MSNKRVSAILPQVVYSVHSDHNEMPYVGNEKKPFVVYYDDYNAMLNLANEMAAELDKLKAANAQLVAVVECAQECMQYVVGDLPYTGYMRDNDKSRAAIGKLRAALAAAKGE